MLERAYRHKLVASVDGYYIGPATQFGRAGPEDFRDITAGFSIRFEIWATQDLFKRELIAS
jgi:hypothetical protein